MAFSGVAGMPIQFKIPKASLQLCQQPTEPNIFYVEDRVDVGRWRPQDLLQKLETILDSINERHKSLRILTNEVFDPIYSILFHMESVSITVRKEVLALLNHGLKNLISFMNSAKVIEWASDNFLSASTIQQLIREDP